MRTTYEWPLMNVMLDGVGRDDLMAGHQSNHVTVAYVDEANLLDVARAFVAQALTQNITVFAAGDLAGQQLPASQEVTIRPPRNDASHARPTGRQNPAPDDVQSWSRNIRRCGKTRSDRPSAAT